jgi:heme ABC exporter ATP-binding subunit CcmA
MKRAMADEPIIHAVDLRKVLGSTVVLDGVNLEVRTGEAVAVLGANGAGKTTLLRILATLWRPTRGRAMVAGIDVAREPARVRERIGFVGHGTLVYDDLTALENLRFWSMVAGRPADGVALRTALSEVDLDGVAGERARSFSAGMKRRLALARALLARPRILLLDEPFASLDQRAKKWLENYLQAFKGGGGTVVLVTHSFGRGLDVADRIVILSAGRVAADVPRPRLGGEEVARLYALHTEDEL